MRLVRGLILRGSAGRSRCRPSHTANLKTQDGPRRADLSGLRERVAREGVDAGETHRERATVRTDVQGHIIEGIGSVEIEKSSFPQGLGRRRRS